MSETLAKDARTAWAWHEYKQSRNARGISSELAQKILDAIPHGDHVEVMVDGDIWAESSVLRAKDRILNRAESNFLARTMRRWIMVTDQLDHAVTLDGPASGGMSVGSAQIDPEPSWITSFDDMAIKVFVDERDSPTLERVQKGAGFEILRLPTQDDVPEAPDLSTVTAETSTSVVRQEFVLMTDWRAAESFALEHMQQLGFHGSHLTGGSSDKGIDIAHPRAVAQVKMQGVPVGAPTVQQLRGASPDLQHHLFYSTSGYTTAAIHEAASSGVALFLMDQWGRATPVEDYARQLEIESSARTNGPEAVIANYMSQVAHRVQLAVNNYGSDEAIKWIAKEETRKGVALRALGYLMNAKHKLERAPQIGDASLNSVLNYYRHMELLAAVCCREMGYAYPGSSPIGKKLMSLDDFY
jgi:hypothetical protein